MDNAPKPTVRELCRKAKNRAGWFCVALLLASAYGLSALYVQHYGMLYCVISTVIIATVTGLGPIISERMRTNVLLMLPMLFSMEGKKVLLIFALTMVVHGPLNNTLENFERAAASTMCGKELIWNQTQQLLQHSVTPLQTVLAKIKDISRNAHSLAGRVQNLIKTLTDSVRHISRSLRNVLHYLASIGDVCNDKMGTPYKSCNALFDEARANCMELLSAVPYLCRIIDAFRPLCGISRVGQFFCIIPSYIGDHLKSKLAFPTIAAFDRIKKEFEFNMTASVNFDMKLNRSQTWQEVSQKVMEEVSGFRQHALNTMYVLDYVGLFLLLFLFFQAVWYQKCYLQGYDFDNYYITKQFEEMDDEDLVDHVLPLRKREAKIYIRTTSCRLPPREGMAVLTGLLSVFYHTVVSSALILLDLIVFWEFDILYQLAQGEIVARAPVAIDLQVNGSGYTSDIFKDLVASFDLIQRGNITVLSKKCLVKPVVPDYMGYIWIGCLYGLAFLLVPIGCYLKRLRRVICAHYHPQREIERIQHLRRRILSQREPERKTLLRMAIRAMEDRVNILQSLTSFLPSTVKNAITMLLGVNVKVCLACGEKIMDISSSNVHTCPNPQFQEHICSQCLSRMGNSCPICTRPQDEEIFQDEIDSSDGE